MYHVPLESHMAWQVTVVSIVDLVDWTELIWIIEIIQLIVRLWHVILNTITILVIDLSWAVWVSTLNKCRISWCCLLLLHVSEELLLGGGVESHGLSCHEASSHQINGFHNFNLIFYNNIYKF